MEIEEAKTAEGQTEKHWTFSLRALLIAVLFVLFVTLSCVIVLTIQVSHRNHNIAQVQRATDKTTKAVARIDTIVQEFKTAADSGSTINVDAVNKFIAGGQVGRANVVKILHAVYKQCDEQGIDCGQPKG